MKILLVAFLAVGIYLAHAAEIQEAYAQIKGTVLDETISGYVSFKKDGEDVVMTVNIFGITVNLNDTHGIHIHQYGDLSTPTDGSSVGSHFNPANKNHGCPEVDGDDRHFGDTGNWEVTQEGTIVGTKTLDLLTLEGPNSIIGRAVVIHSFTDDCETVASSGTRLAWGVIGIRNPGTDTNTAVNGDDTIINAVCDLQPTANNNVTGRVWFQKSGNDTIITAKVTGITGPHGFHIHEFGDLSSADASKTGSHYNPANDLHGIPEYTPRHVGDMGNIYHYVGDVAYYKFTHDMIHLSGAWSVIGHAVIVHSAKDDCGQPTGNAGSRLAQCVIGIAADTTTPTGIPNDVPTTQDDSACEVSTTDETQASNTDTDTGASNTDAPKTSEDESSGVVLGASTMLIATILAQFW